MSESNLSMLCLSWLTSLLNEKYNNIVIYDSILVAITKQRKHGRMLNYGKQYSTTFMVQEF